MNYKAILDNLVTLVQVNECKYPIKPFHPNNNYPEYKYDELSEEKNEVYDKIREAFYLMGLDKDNFGAINWNPLGDIVKPGDQVLLKPNLVLHENPLGFNIDSLVTNGSLIRAVIDYVIIALKGKGKIIVGDASLQKCDFNLLIEKNGLVSISDYYKTKGIILDIVDFRSEYAIIDSHYQILEIKKNPRELNYQVVDLGQESALNPISDGFANYRVTNYDPRLMKNHHNNEKNEYLIPKIVLNSDVIINMPKPKTHRKAGLTAAMKNMVGINGHKDWLPHHRTGSIKEGGDEYLNNSLFKKMYVKVQEKVDILSINNKPKSVRVLNFIKRFFSIAFRKTSKDFYMEGSWWGNDTIWRTCVDLNKILYNSDQNGIIKENQQREILTICDMIISGESEGPLDPTPKDIGLLILGRNNTAIDAVVCEIMGFDHNKIASIQNSFDKKFNLANFERKDIICKSNIEEINGASLTELGNNLNYNFKPSKGWKGHIEK